MNKTAKTFAGGLAALAMGAAALTSPTPASADSAGAAIASGIGGFALGALLGSAARPYPYYGYYGAPAYYPAPAYYYRCWREDRPVYDAYGAFLGYRPQRVCE